MAEDNLYLKIARVMGSLSRLPKSGWNKHFKYHFVTDADVADAVRERLAAERIAFFASMVNHTKTGDHTEAVFEFTFVCADTGETMKCQWAGEAIDKQDKGLSKAATSAEKYFLLKTFMLSTGESTDDPDSSAGEVPNSRQIDSASWTHNEARRNDFFQWAFDYWRESDPDLPKPRAVNRIAKALKLPKCNGKSELLHTALEAKYKGSEQEAAAAIVDYKSEDGNE
jgi:hypothetical protein